MVLPASFPCFSLVPLVSALFVLLLAFNVIRGSRYSLPLLVSTTASCQACGTSNISVSIDLDWHAPDATVINSISSVINGSGIYGFIFDDTQKETSYETYNWCSMPHVRPQEYQIPPSNYILEYVEVIHRHHKRTPYASNTFPHETYPWYCDDEALFYYGSPYPDVDSAQINCHVSTSAANPFAPAGFNGSCQFPQITRGGLDDSMQHGKDLFGVYHDLLDFIPGNLDTSKVSYRVTNNVITSQVASQVLRGMYPGVKNTAVTVLIQPASIDSLEPTYSCPTAKNLYASYGVGSTSSDWLAHLNLSSSLFVILDDVSGVKSTDPDWHKSFDHYFDNLSARLCHAKPLPCSFSDPSKCLTQTEANAVFRAGLYEYSFIYRDSPDSLAASTASFGVWIAELAANIRNFLEGKFNVIYRHNVAHDGSISRLLSILQINIMVWPGMGSELVFEVYKREETGCSFVRVLWGGQVLNSSNPTLGFMNMVPVEMLLGYFDGLVGPDAGKVPGLCE